MTLQPVSHIYDCDQKKKACRMFYDSVYPQPTSSSDGLTSSGIIEVQTILDDNSLCKIRCISIALNFLC